MMAAAVMIATPTFIDDAVSGMCCASNRENLVRFITSPVRVRSRFGVVRRSRQRSWGPCTGAEYSALAGNARRPGRGNVCPDHSNSFAAYRVRSEILQRRSQDILETRPHEELGYSPVNDLATGVARTVSGTAKPVGCSDSNFVFRLRGFLARLGSIQKGFLSVHCRLSAR